MSAPEPAELDAEFAQHFGRTKASLIDAASDTDLAIQTGGAYLPGVVSMPDATHMAVARETRIETFIVSADGDVSPTGSDADLIELFTPTATEVARRILASCTQNDIILEGDSYLTASVTPVSEVIGDPHFDDQQFDAADGVGLVAIVADIDGSRVATEPVIHAGASTGLPLEVNDEVFEAFAVGDIAQQHTAANRIVVFPQFAQLHSGPPLASTTTGDNGNVRCMVVFRARTAPSADDASKD